MLFEALTANDDPVIMAPPSAHSYYIENNEKEVKNIPHSLHVGAFSGPPNEGHAQFECFSAISSSRADLSLVSK